MSELGGRNTTQHHESRALEWRLVGVGEVVSRRESKVEPDLGQNRDGVVVVVGAGLTVGVRECPNRAPGPFRNRRATGDDFFSLLVAREGGEDRMVCGMGTNFEQLVSAERLELLRGQWR